MYLRFPIFLGYTSEEVQLLESSKNVWPFVQNSAVDMPHKLRLWHPECESIAGGVHFLTIVCTPFHLLLMLYKRSYHVPKPCSFLLECYNYQTLWNKLVMSWPVFHIFNTYLNYSNLHLIVQRTFVHRVWSCIIKE